MSAQPLGAAEVGIGLRTPHCGEILERRPALGFLEVHSENYFGGAAAATLELVRRDYPVTLHGVGLSLGSADPLDARHLAKLAQLAHRIEPALVSEHLCWTSIGGRHANELLPMPFTREAAAHIAARIAEAQDHLGRQLLVENVSAYHWLGAAEMSEAEFVAEVARRAGCALLLDVNNIHVNAANFGFDPCGYLSAIDPSSVAQYHLGGFEPEGEILVDTHGARVSDAVWSLYQEALQRIGPRPTLIEWDTRLPALGVLLDEAGRARAVSQRVREAVAA